LHRGKTLSQFKSQSKSQYLLLYMLENANQMVSLRGFF